jgi:uncharacterized protein YebE (UPF0316 family)
MTSDVLFGAVLIVLARVADVSLGTLRTVAVIHGRKAMALTLGFVEVLIWVTVVSEVLPTVRDNWLNAVAYAFGFATGTYIGIVIEQYFAFGRQIVRVFTRNGAVMAEALRGRGHVVTEFEGKGRDGPVAMLFVETERRDAHDVVRIARTLDINCFYTIGDIREASSGRVVNSQTPPSQQEMKRR